MKFDNFHSNHWSRFDTITGRNRINYFLIIGPHQLAFYNNRIKSSLIIGEMMIRFMAEIVSKSDSSLMVREK